VGRTGCRIRRAAFAAALVAWAWSGAFAGARERLEVGLQAYRDGFYGLAAEELRAYAEAEPEDPNLPDLLDLLFRAEVARKNPDGARWALERLVERGEIEAEYWLGWLEAGEGRHAVAWEHLTRYFAAGGGGLRKDARLLAAASAQALGRWKDAAEQYRAFLAEAEGDPRRPSAWLGLVRALQEQGDPTAVLETAREALADPAVPGDPEARLSLSRAGASVASTPRDQAFFWERVARWTPDREERAQALLAQGRSLADAEEPRAAAKALGALLALVPKGEDAVSAHLLLADLARKSGDLRGGLRHLEGSLEAGVTGTRAIEVHRAAFALARKLGDPEAVRRHGRALLDAGARVPREELDRARWALAEDALREGRWQAAVELWDAIAPEGPLGRAARLGAARVLLERGKPGETLRRIEPILGAESPAAAWLVALAAAEALGDSARAARFAERAAGAAPPAEVPALLERAAAHAEAVGDSDRAAELRRRLAERHADTPEGARAALALQVKAFRSENWREVLRWSRGARQADPSGAAELRQAEALARTGRLDDARRVWEAVAARPGPQRGRALLRLGVQADQAGRAGEALARYRAALGAGLGPEAGAWVRKRVGELQADARDR